MISRFRPGTKMNSPSHGDNPAVILRRTLIVTAIHRKGSVQMNHAQPSHAAPATSCCLLEMTGLKNSWRDRIRPVTCQSTASSTTYLTVISPNPQAAYVTRSMFDSKPNNSCNSPETERDGLLSSDRTVSPEASCEFPSAMSLLPLKGQ